MVLETLDLNHVKLIFLNDRDNHLWALLQYMAQYSQWDLRLLCGGLLAELRILGKR